MNHTHDYDFMGPQLCTDLFIEIEFRATQSLHACDSSLPELRRQRNPIVLGRNQTHPASEELYTLPINEATHDEQSFFYAQDYFIKKDETLHEFDLQIMLSQKFIDQHTIVPIVEVLEIDLESEHDYDINDYKLGQHPECHLECLIGGHKLYNAFSIMTSVPHGSLVRVWLYQDECLNPVKLLAKKTAETCVNYALSVMTVEQESQEH